jgi:hypothetical protein
MWGTPNQWDPRAFVQEKHPRVRVVETDKLPAQLLGCVDHEDRIIWIAAGLDEARYRCTLAFEVAQLQQGPTPDDPCLARAYQRAAEEWAALMLIPTDAFVAAWVGFLDLRSMAARLKVDLATFRARIRAASDADQDAVMDAIAATRMSA